MDNEYFMKKALEEAVLAYERGEVPVGAIVVSNNHIIAKAHNNTEQLHDVTAHAEIMAITSAANYLQSKLKKLVLPILLPQCFLVAFHFYHYALFAHAAIERAQQTLYFPHY